VEARRKMISMIEPIFFIVSSIKIYQRLIANVVGNDYNHPIEV